MNKIVLTTDSGMCALKKEDSIIIPAQLNSSNGKSYYDNGKISNEKILKDMEKGIIYKTSSPLLGDFQNTFRPILEDGKDIIHLSMSSGISEGSVNSANIIANELNQEYKNKVYIIDSSNQLVDYTSINTDIVPTSYLSTNGPGSYYLVIVSDTCYAEGYFTL